MRPTLAADNDNNEHRFYIYAWQYPDGRTFYVGKGQCGRDAISKRNNLFNNIVSKIQREGGEPRVVRWHEGLREDDAFVLEKSYIRLFGRRDLGTGILANLTDGGEGGSGRIITEETRAKLGAWERTADTRAKISVALKGKPKSGDHTAKSVAARSGKPLSYEHRAKIANALRGVPKHPDAIAKTSEANRGKKRSPEARARMSAAKKGKALSESHRARLVEKLRLAKPRSGFKGVFFDKQRSKWYARISIDGTKTYLGRFDAAEEAAYAYDYAAYAAYKDACYLNFPDRLNCVAA